MKSKEKPIWAVMVPLQEDGGGEWIMPELQVWFDKEEKALDWAKNWSLSHHGAASIYECRIRRDISLKREAVFDIEDF